MSATFRTITDADWARELRAARARPNQIRAMIAARLPCAARHTELSDFMPAIDPRSIAQPNAYVKRLESL